MKFAIIDIETTGGNSKNNKITEIAIAIFENGKIINTFESLLNPQQDIPYFIQKLTGINNKMVANAPKFHQVAKDIVNILEGCVFVAHNVKFDYNFIKNEFEELGYNFKKKQLCTIKLSREYFPGIKSYGLDNLIKHFKFDSDNRHRAMGDVLVTIKLFEKIYHHPNFEKNIESHLYDGLTSRSIPPNISLNQVSDIPEKCGNLFLHDKNNTVIYAATSSNIKKSIIKILRNPTKNFRKQFENIHDISYEYTGNEIMASIILDKYFQYNTPILNQQSNKYNFKYIIQEGIQEDGYKVFSQLRLHKKKIINNKVIASFTNKKAVLRAIDTVSQKHRLCRSLNKLEKGKPCFGYYTKQCLGACTHIEPKAKYNSRFDTSMMMMKDIYSNEFLIQDNGRQIDESCLYYFSNRKLKGYLWISKDQSVDMLSIKSIMTEINLSEDLNLRLLSNVIGNKANYLVI